MTRPSPHQGLIIADGKLFLWEWSKLRWQPLECSISEDVYGVWCLMSRDKRLRVPLASICMVRIVKAGSLEEARSLWAARHHNN